MTTQVSEDESSTDDRANTEASRELAQSNSKSEDEQLMEVMLYVRTTHEVEHNDNQWTREFVYSFDEAKAKINRLIVEAKRAEVKELVHVAYHNSASKEDRKLFQLAVERIAELSKELGDSNE